MFIRFLKKVEKIMNIGRIGALINYERTKQNISIDKLRAGVCSEAVLRRLCKQHSHSLKGKPAP